MKKFFIILTSLILCIGASTYASAEQLPKPSSDIVMLVNQDNSISKDYAPSHLSNISKLVKSSKSEMLLKPEAAEAYIEMYKAMLTDGIPAPIAISGYRTYDYQKGLFDRKVKSYTDQGMKYEDAYKKASTSVAIPGTSEHQTGLAIDISTDGSLSSNFAKTDAGKWLGENSWRYGYILRYMEDKSELTKIIFEPWHFRYVGKPHAQIMYENQWCLEEYISELAKAGEFTLSNEIGTYYVRHISQNIEDYSEDNLPKDEILIDFSKDNTRGYIVTSFKSLEKE